MNRNRRLAGRIAEVLVTNNNRLHSVAIYGALLHGPAGSRLTRDTLPNLGAVIRIRLIRGRAMESRLR